MATAPKEIIDLVERFERQFESYKSGQYNETQLRREFLDPFFKALGWDIDNNAGHAEAYKDVIHEDQIRIASATKAPDYCFCIGGTRKYFLEAKKPSVVIKNEPGAAYQLRRYAWSAKLPLSILSDFEELAVYDGRVKPNKDDSASVARIFYCTFRDYAEKWDWIYERFSRDAVLKGAFDKFADSTRAKRGATEVDTAFLETIEGWRKELAQNLALRNAELTQRELNFAVQRIIDRIIFLRICEDRGIEVYGRLQALVNGDRIFPRLSQLFEQADDRYNSGLFHFKKEPGRHEAPDALTLGLDIDDKLLRDLLRGLYYPDSPYEFSVLSADILGQVYEQFLGKVIRLTEGHRAVVDDKPEVKKAGGVYYTPTYIVDYIVRQTVGTLVDDIGGMKPGLRPDSAASAVQADQPGKSAPSIDAASRKATAILNRVAHLRILDPACGSGSFLIGAYQFLLDWHLQFYLANDPVKWSKEIRGRRHPVLVQGRKGGLQLSIAERKRILLANIYGVDIDSQAVEVTKLSLLLKVLEGESGQAQIYFALKDRVLPDLGDNIKCGNSLIGPDFYQQSELPLLTDEERYRINVFDWEAEFADIFKNGGFNAVIGNPPYLDVKELPALIKSELTRTYNSATNRFDLYVPFVERCLMILSAGGLLGFILPSMFMWREYGSSLRKVIVSQSRIAEVVDFGTNQIFAGPLNYVAVVSLIKDRAKRSVAVTKFRRTGVSPFEIKAALDRKKVSGVSFFTAPQDSFGASGEWQLLDRCESRLSDRLFREFEPLETLVRFASEGIHSGKDEVFFVPRDKMMAAKLESPPVFPLAKGKDIHRYEAADCKTYQTCVVFPYDLTSGEVLSEKLIEANFPNVWTYFLNSRGLLKGRSYFDRSSKAWYELWCPRDPALYTSQKIVGPEIANKGEFTLARKQLFVNNKLKVIVLREQTPEAPEYILGLLNSSLLTYLHRLIAPPKGNNYFEVKTRIVGRLPIRRIDFSEKTDKAAHDRTVKLVEQMLEGHKQLAMVRTPQERTSLERQIAATDAQIDRLVYDLYGLTEDEIEIVEGTVVTDALEKAAEPMPAEPIPNGQSTAESEAAAAHFYFVTEEPKSYDS
jgi:type I restriction-modification system DNA methylase subunit